MAFDMLHAGTGTRVLLLHSGMCTWVEFRRLIDLLAERHEVLAPTLPGSFGGPPLDHGTNTMLGSQAAYVEELLHARGWTEGITVVGSSYGGVLGMELLARGVVSRVVALAPPWVSGAGLAFYGALFSGLPATRLSRPMWRWSTRIGTLNGLWFHQSRTPPLIDPEDVAAILESWSRFPFYRVGLAGGRAGPGMPDLARLDGSAVTLVWGGSDRLVPHWMRRRWAAALPDANVVDLPGFPHQPHLRDPAVIAGVLSGA